MYLVLNIENFAANKVNKPFSIKIQQSGIYSIKTCKQNSDHFFKVLSGLETKFEGDVKLNNISIKEDLSVVKYLQKNILFIEDLALFFNLTVLENMEIFSKIWSNGENLAEFAISYFKMEKIRNQIVRDLEIEDLKLLNLTKTLTCPAAIWLIDNKLMKELKEENKDKFDKLIDLRLKQDGIIILIDN